MIFAFRCGLNTSKQDYEYLTKKYNDYTKAFHFGYWVRVNVLRKIK